MQAAIATPEAIEQVEQNAFTPLDVEGPVAHHFGPGTYIREVSLQAGFMFVSRHQRLEHLTTILTGSIALINDDGLIEIIRAPLTFASKPGRAMGCVLEDCFWQSIYATEERDIKKLEGMLFEKGVPWAEHQERMFVMLADEQAADRDSYKAVIALTGLTAEEIRANVENETDQIAMPEGTGQKVVVRLSLIHGQGIFLSASADAGEVIAPARIDGMRTPAARFANHAVSPNAVMVARPSGDIDLVALRPIRGCAKDERGEEVTVDYAEVRAATFDADFKRYLAAQKQAPKGDAA